MCSSDLFPVAADDYGTIRLSPTDISQFIRLEQCERYLRLRLHERTVNAAFMRDYGVTPQSIPPLLTRSGATFEAQIVHGVASHYRTISFVDERTQDHHRANDNDQVLALVHDLPPSETVVLFQPRVQVQINGWLLRGDVDLLRVARDAAGTLQVLIADIKSSTSGKIEHRLQVAFYREMLATLLQRAGLPDVRIDIAILYRGPADDHRGLTHLDAKQLAEQRDAAEHYFGTRDGFLDIVTDPDSYRGAVEDLVTGSDSTARRVVTTDFERIPYHLTYKCDGCLYNELCMKWSAEQDDLSLLPHLTDHDKRALQRVGITTVHALATLKEFRAPGSDELVPAAGQTALVRQLSATWPVGPRLDELVHRARRYRAWKGEPLASRPYIPTKRYGSLPYCDAIQNPNLVRVYIDAQHDYLHDRIYMLGALVVANEAGIERPERRRSIVHLSDRPPASAEQERQLFVHWMSDTMRAVVELAAPDEHGQQRAPIHLIFWNSFDQRLLLDGLSRHFTSILAATPLYDFMTQLAAFDSPIASFLDQEIRDLKNYPMVCQSLQAVAAYLKFDWNAGVPYREIFRTRMFDFWGKLDQVDETTAHRSRWYTSRSRFNSQIPLEFAYAAWGELPEPLPGQQDDLASYRGATVELLQGFHARRLETLEWIATDFSGNKQTEKTSFNLPALSAFNETARTLAQALDEFVTIERHVELNAWKTARLAPPERRVLAGDTLLVRYVATDQDPYIAERNRENERRRQLQEQYRAAYRAANPGATRATLTRQQQHETRWSQEGMRVRLRLECAGVDCDLDEALALATLKEGSPVVICPRTTVDSRLPVEEQTPFTPTPKQMLYSTRGQLVRLVVKRDSAGRAVSGYAEVELRGARGGTWSRGFVFSSYDRPFIDGEYYTLDEDPNSWYGYWCAKVTEGLCAGEHNTLYQRLVDPVAARARWSAAAAEGGAPSHDGRSSSTARMSRCS